MSKIMALKPVSLKNIRVNDEFWGKYFKILKEVVIPYQWNALNNQIPGVEASHAVENFRIAAKESEGEHHGYVFQDSDLAKWIEAVAYTLESFPNQDLEKIVDYVIDLIAKAQQANGYLNSYYTIAEPGKQWTDVRRNHELYCAGHLIEAAVAYYEATGKKKFLDVMCRYVDHIESVFGSEEGKKKGYPGHPEIELALVRLYRVTGEKRYLKLSKFFIDQRGQKPHYFDIEARARGQLDHSDYFGDYTYEYVQSHKPVREQIEATGHAVRAMYLYSGMADVAVECGDYTLIEACRKLWDSVTKNHLYITGGIGSSCYGESFTVPYDLPNDTAYAETCASIGLVFFAHRMLQVEPDGKYADVMERALYNGVLSGISLDGKSFFYVNPLEVWPDSCLNRMDKKHIKTVRQGWFGCACCPPNIARFIASLGKYIYSSSSDSIYVHLYAGSETDLNICGHGVKLIQKTGYPWTEDVEIIVKPEHTSEFTIALRIPGWSRNALIKINGETCQLCSIIDKGYAKIKRLWKDGDIIQVELPMPVERVMANPEVRENAGKVALQRGPIVYCLEEVDNGKNLWDITLTNEYKLISEYYSELLGGVVVIKGNALRSDDSCRESNLYYVGEKKYKKVNIQAIPYSRWCNRKPGEMLVWVRQRE